MDFPWPWNRKYTMNWFLLSLLNHHLDQLLERYRAACAMYRSI